jgi:hypothetical protein
MNGKNHAKSATSDLGIELEYKALREEILARIKLRQQIVATTLTLSGAFLGFGLQHTSVALIYPPLAFFLAIGWAQNDYRIRNLATYIRKQIEPSFVTEGWETKIMNERKKTGLSQWRYIILSHGGAFIVSQLLAVGIGISTFTSSFIEWFLLVVDMLSIISVAILLRKSK